MMLQSFHSLLSVMTGVPERLLTDPRLFHVVAGWQCLLSGPRLQRVYLHYTYYIYIIYDTVYILG